MSDQQNVEAIVKAYSKLRAKKELLALEEKELKSQLIDVMKTNNVKTIDGKYGTFSYSTRVTKTINDPKVAEAELALKKAKHKAVEAGNFTTKETETLSYRPVED